MLPGIQLFGTAFAFILLHRSLGTTRNDEIRLRTFLFSNYSTNIRPMFNLSKTLDLNCTYNLHAIHELDEKKQTLHTSGYLYVRWRDEMLVWNPEDFGGLEDILVRTNQMWIPDIIILNGADGYILGGTDFMVNVRYTGEADWSPGGVYHTACPIDVTKYPFDNQTCKIFLGSWMHSSKKIAIKEARVAVDVNRLWASGEWFLVGSAVQESHVEFNGDHYKIVHISLLLRRRRLYYVITIIVPMICLSFLNVLVFFIPVESGEKMSLSITALLAYSVFLSMVSDNMPGISSSVSILAVFLTAILFMGMVSAVISGISLWIVNSQGRPLRRSCSRKRPSLLGVTRPSITTNFTEKAEPFIDGEPENNSRSHTSEPLTHKPYNHNYVHEYGMSGQTFDVVRKIDKYSFYVSLTITLGGICILLCALLS